MTNFTAELKWAFTVRHSPAYDSTAITIPKGTAFTCYKGSDGYVHFTSIVEGIKLTLPASVARGYFTKPEPIEEAVTSAEDSGVCVDCGDTTALGCDLRGGCHFAQRDAERDKRRG